MDPTIRRGIISQGSHLAMPVCGMSEENDGGVTAKALIPAAFFGSCPRIISVGISRNPGPTPRNPLSIDNGDYEDDCHPEVLTAG